MTPDAQALRYFLAVAEERNFTHAAALLGIAQPALSAHIQRLETALNVKLLERTTRRVDLTAAGRILAERGPTVLESFDALWEQVRRTGAGESGAVTMLHSATVGSQTVPILLKGLSELLPDVRLAAKAATTSTIGPAIARGEADLGLTRCAQGAPGTRDVLVRRETGGALVAVGHPLGRRRRLTLRDVAAYPVILHAREANPAHHDMIVRLFADAGLSPRFVQPPMAVDLSQSFIRSTEAVGIVGESAVAVTPPGTKWLPLRESAAMVPTYLVLPTGPLNPLQERLERAVTAIAEEQGWLRPDAPDL